MEKNFKDAFKIENDDASILSRQKNVDTMYLSTTYNVQFLSS